MTQNQLLLNFFKHAPKWVVLCIDLFIVLISFVLSYFIRFNLSLDFQVDNLILQLPMMALFAVTSFLITGSFKGVIRHTGVKDVYNLFNAICLMSIIVIAFVILNRQLDILSGFTIPLSIIIIHSLISFMVLTASRYVYKSIYRSLISNLNGTKNVLIFGAGESGIITYNAITSNSKNALDVIGFVDHDKSKAGKMINSVKVYSPEYITPSFIAKKEVSEVIFSIQNIDSITLRNLVDEMVGLSLSVKIVPPVEDWINGELKASQIKPIQIEDLLDRSPINIKNPRVARELDNQIILITGGAGSIGSELVRQAVTYKYHTLLVVDQAESALYDLQQELKQMGFHKFVPIVADIRDKNRMRSLFKEYCPSIVFHAAAYKHVPLMEYNPYEAIKINILGTKVIADLSVEFGVKKFVFVSTDKAVNPTNVMGATKRIAEIYISCKQQEGKTRFITTRFGNVLGSNGSVIPLFKKQMAKGGPLTVTHKDVTRYFMTIPEASQLVMEAGVMGKGGEIFIFDMGESIKIFDLAKNMIKLSGLKYPEDIDIKFSGLRPGEKLYEELLANGEDTLPTYHKKIMISKAIAMDYSGIKDRIEELCVANMFLKGDTVKIMKEIIPEYISQNSTYCELDKKSEKPGQYQQSEIMNNLTS